MQSPDYETRMAILRKHAESRGYILTDDKDDTFSVNFLKALDYIATHFVSNVRELEGSLNNVIAFSKINNDSEITAEFAAETLKVENKENKITCDYIINIVAEHFQISPADICSKKKSKEIAYPRQVCMYLCRVYTDEKLSTIAAALKKNNHATVSFGYEKIKNEIEEDDNVRNMIDVLKKKINPN